MSTVPHRLEALFERGQVEERAAGVEVDQEVDVGVRALLAVGHGAEHAHVTRATRGGGGADLGPKAEQAVEEGHGRALESPESDGPARRLRTHGWRLPRCSRPQPFQDG